MATRENGGRSFTFGTLRRLNETWKRRASSWCLGEARSTPVPFPSSFSAGVGSLTVFTVEQRDDLRGRVLRIAAEDERVVAGALVGSLAISGGDRFSDLDLTFGVADQFRVTDVLHDWTRTLIDELHAVKLGERYSDRGGWECESCVGGARRSRLRMKNHTPAAITTRAAITTTTQYAALDPAPPCP
jgi:hypothetical protein